MHVHALEQHAPSAMLAGRQALCQAHHHEGFPRAPVPVVATRSERSLVCIQGTRSYGFAMVHDNPG